MKRAVCMILQRQDGKILAVSRKNDMNKFGLPGGKVDPGETDEEAIIREVKEETGLTVDSLHKVFRNECTGEVRYDTRTYFAGSVSGEIGTDEPIAIGWVTTQVLLDGPFGSYMKVLFDKLGITDKTTRCSYCNKYAECITDRLLKLFPLICKTCYERRSDVRLSCG